MKPREKAKEEAMKLLKSGAISIENKNERHTFKRKPKESEEDEVPGPNITDVSDSCSVDQLHSPNRPVHSTLYVGYHNITESFIHDVFKPHGTVVRIRIGNPSNHAYVTMATNQMAQSALKLDHQMVSNRLLRVSFARRPFHVKPFSPTKYSPYRSFRKPACCNSNEEPSNRISSELNRDLITYEDLYSDK
ncbi:unnamed protein product [Schistosoma intercalatum]|nr:unnamed protein product [Schistosoma intercalatum]